MKIKELEAKIVALEKEIAELKKCEPVVINFPPTPVCPLQHYPSIPNYPNPYFPQFPNPNYPVVWCGDFPNNISC